MPGRYILVLERFPPALAFAALKAVFLAVGYSFIGAIWLVHKRDTICG
ncbi:hypothetical protein R5H30_18175 [Sulfitobacter sp. D35]|nr:hypothetical protein [Sulfitobacter sp. D35]MDW4499925.1 hypothetical protein [Sulfitobacter sp. D35]